MKAGAMSGGRRRRPAVWLLDSADPTGAAAMTVRRMHVLADRLASIPLVLGGTRAQAPASSPLYRPMVSTSLRGEVRMARADLVVTTSEQTLASAAPRVRPGAALVHVVHTDPQFAFASERIIRVLARATAVVVPAGTDPTWFADTVGIAAELVVALDDFTLPDQTLLGTAEAHAVLAIGRLTPASGILDLLEAFRLARPALPGWHLRIAGWGELATDVAEFVDVHGLGPHVRLLGRQWNPAECYLDAGVTVRLDTADANGLPVLESLTAGVPVIGAPTVPAVTRLVHSGVNGLVLDRTDPHSIAEALVRTADDEYRSRLAAGARANPGGALDSAGHAALRDLIDAALHHRPVNPDRRPS